jgi:hypothetical protein
MPPRADLLDRILGGMDDAALRLRRARQRMTLEVAIRGVRLSQGLAEGRSRVEQGARQRLGRLRRGAARPLERAAGALARRLPIASEGDFRRIEGRVALLARELDALASARPRPPSR